MLSPTLCEVMVHNDIVAKLFKLLCNVNRGVADSEVANMCSKILLIFCKYERTIEDVWAVSIRLTVQDFHVHYMFFTNIVHMFSLGWYLPSLLPIPDEEMDTS